MLSISRDNELIVFSQLVDKGQYLVLSISHYHFEVHTLTITWRKQYFVCGNGTILILFLHTDGAVTRKWKHSHLPASEYRKHVRREDSCFGLLQCRQRRGYWMNVLAFDKIVIFLNVGISSSGRAMFSLYSDKTMKERQVIFKIFVQQFIY